MSEFSDRPLVAGSILGVRSFRVNADGLLTGVMQQNAKFGPGENPARCLSPGAGFLAFHQAMMAALGKANAATLGMDGQHRGGSKTCTCGFYAYFDGSNDYQMYLRLEEAMTSELAGFTGIIEGTGVVTVGSRGFRAERARLVALVTPAQVVEQPRRPRARLIAYTGFLAFDLLGFAASLAAGRWWLALLYLLMVVFFGLATRVLWREWRAKTSIARSAATMLAKVRRNYPGVPWYLTTEAAMAAHPLTPPAPAETEAAS